MKAQLNADLIKSIAEEVDCGFRCFYLFETREVISYPANDDMDSELWKDEIKKVPRSKKKYIEFTPMESFESFEVMEDFIEEITNETIKQQFENVLQRRKPFQHFKDLLLDYPDVRSQWFEYKRQRTVEYIEEQIQFYNHVLHDD